MQLTTLTTLLSIAVLGAVSAPGAYAGEAYVTNTDRNAWGYNKTDVNVKSKDWSRGYRKFSSHAEKIYIDGDIGVGKGGGFKGVKSLKPRPQKVGFDDFTVHTAESHEFGYEAFGSDSKSNAKIWSYEKFDENSHTSAAGVR